MLMSRSTPDGSLNARFLIHHEYLESTEIQPIYGISNLDDVPMPQEILLFSF